MTWFRKERLPLYSTAYTTRRWREYASPFLNNGSWHLWFVLGFDNSESAPIWLVGAGRLHPQVSAMRMVSQGFMLLNDESNRPPREVFRA